MLVDGLNLLDGSIKNLTMEAVTAFPTTQLAPGRLVYLTVAVGANSIGMYVYNGTAFKQLSFVGTVTTAAGTTTTTATDSFFSSVRVLLHMDGLNGSAAFPDTISNNIWTPNIATVSTTQSKFGGASAYFNGASDLRTPHKASLDLVTGDFTLEAWIYPTALTTTTQLIIDKDGQAGISYSQYALGLSSAGKALVILGSGNSTASYQIITGNITVGLNAWSHIAVVRAGNQILIFVNGVLDVTATQTATVVSGGKPLFIGYQLDQPAANRFNGYIDDVRITAASRYTATFPVPTAAFPDAGTTSTVTAAGTVSLLMYCDGANLSKTLIDSSPNPKTLVAFNNTSLLTDPSHLKYGSAGLEIPSGNSCVYITQYSDDFDFGSGDFTMECWFNPVGNTGSPQTLFSVVGTKYSFYTTYYSITGLSFYLYNIDGTITSITGAPFGTAGGFHHVAFTREGTQVKIWVDGTLSASQPIAGGALTIQNSRDAVLTIGQRTPNGIEGCSADFDNIRVTKGSAVYKGTAPFTPPGAQF